MIELYGVENPMMSSLFNNNRIKNSFKINEFFSVKYQGKYELDFLVFCKKNNIFVERPNFTIPYLFLSEEKKYIPDFYISNLNLIIEIKSTYYFNLDKDKNIKKIEAVKDNGYNFILILDKKYKEFKEFYEKNIGI
jgi:Uma2 family endonuclease